MINRELDRCLDAFWLEYRTKVDEKNLSLIVYGDPLELYPVAISMRESGIFDGYVIKGRDGIVIQIIGPYDPRPRV